LATALLTQIFIALICPVNI